MAADLISLSDVLKRTGLARRTLFRMRQRGEFPAGLRIGTRNVLWISEQVDEWVRRNNPARVIRCP